MIGVRRFGYERFVALPMLLALASGVTVGVVGGRRADGATNAPDACGLLTPQALHAVLGGRIADGSPLSSPNSSETICEWTVYRNARQGYGAELHVYAGRGSNDFKRQRGMASAPTHTVKHLADGAFSERAVFSGHVFDDLWVRQATTVFRIETLRDLGTKPLIKLARIVLKNLSRGSP